MIWGTMAPESKATFFRQSGWLMAANTLCGFSMAAVHFFAASLPEAEYGIFFTLLRVLMLLSIPAAGLQIVFAEQAAAALDEGRQRQLARTVRAVLLATFLLWLAVSGVVWFFRVAILREFKMTHASALAVTLWVALAALWLPTGQGVLQGRQKFGWLGGSLICNGVGRLASVSVIVVVMHGQSTGAMAGALLGFLAACVVAFWPCRSLLALRGGHFLWSSWLQRVAPLTLGVGASLFVMNADMVAVQSQFPKQATPFYAAAAMIGVAIVLFTTPVASVMFPKIVNSIAQAQQTDALWLALAGTAILGAAAALGCTFFPQLPLRILYHRNPEYLRSAVLVPWFVWCMVPVTLSNVLIVNLLARGWFRVVPWAVAIAGGYGCCLVWVARSGAHGEPFAAFRHIIQLLGGFSSLLLLVSVWFNWNESRRRLAAVANPAPSARA